MSKTMLIDAAHPEETRVVVLAGNQIDDFDFESASKKQIRGNIYLAKVTRVEPSLQAGFVEYGGNRHGFLAFGEIHPDYYQIPAADREAILAEEAAQAALDEESDGDDEQVRARRAAQRRYKIQEVIRRRQIMLVQAVKEERGNKGAALTTYLSLAGRYCVLMPNTPRGGGISRKITAAGDRKRLKSVISELEVPKGMGLIIRTAGAKRTKTEIKRDYEYLLRLWDDIRDRTMKSIAPALIHEEDNLVKRAVRDLYDKDVDAILVEGEEAYREAKDFIKMLMPSHAKKVQQYKAATPLFSRMKVESQLENIHSPVVQLRSGGYIVINQTEALVAIDVNSGRSTRERSIESTALKTNLEAAEEAARQMRLRDLAGLVVVDFIDMEESRNDRAVEKRMKDALRFDRARVQMGKISGFGLLEISRQRRRTGVLEGSSHVCPTCEGTGRVRSPESASLQALRAVEAAVASRQGSEIALHADIQTALYLLNEKRDHLSRLMQERGLVVRVFAESDMNPGQFRFEIIDLGEEMPEDDFVPVYVKIDEPADEDEEIISEDDDDAEAESESDEDEAVSSRETGEAEGGREGGKRRRRRRRGGRREEAPETEEAAEASEGDEAAGDSEDAPLEGETPAETQARRRRRRGRRGGRRRREGEAQRMSQADGDEAAPAEIAGMETIDLPESAVEVSVPFDAVIAPLPEAEAPAKRKRPGRKKAAEAEATPAPEDAAPAAEVIADVAEPVAVEEAPKSKKAPAKRATKAAKAKSEDSAPAPTTSDAAPEALPPETPIVEAPAAEPVEEAPPGPRRTGWWSRNAQKLFGK
ncbi:ribonuclease E [Candidatus Phycosocius bacilliformis]|uniref:Ribonuclease E n=1 Tax=Candidatus Phycosocius bacilliformis TaxID=1445552 RepID=A0A2P2EBC5_9PROT|nr:ribonuclease E/G [Candidatus Phycosocius bacilliformis]GBF58343.1 ribonuclease E [Candidatus Phycosocius bacilliformis]